MDPLSEVIGPVRKRTTPRYPDVRPIRNRPVSRLQTREQTPGRASAPLQGRDQHIRCGPPQARARRRSSPARPCTRPDKPGTLALLASWSEPPRTSITESTEQHSGSLTSWGLAILRHTASDHSSYDSSRPPASRRLAASAASPSLDKPAITRRHHRDQQSAS